jgi:hypothetical protein
VPEESIATEDPENNLMHSDPLRVEMAIVPLKRPKGYISRVQGIVRVEETSVAQCENCATTDSDRTRSQPCPARHHRPVPAAGLLPSMVPRCPAQTVDSWYHIQNARIRSQLLTTSVPTVSPAAEANSFKYPNVGAAHQPV